MRLRMPDVVDLATSAPPPPRHTVEEILQRGQRVERRRRAGWVASGAAAVAVLGVTAAVTVAAQPNGRPDGGVAVGSSGAPAAWVAAPPPFSFTFGASKVGKLSVGAPVDVSTAYQIAPVRSDDDARLYAYLTLFRPGAFDPAQLAGAQPITVGGRPGLQHVTDGPIYESHVLTVAWQYTPGAWAALTAHLGQGDDLNAGSLLDLAAGLRPVAPAPAKLPFTLSYVPAGYHLNEVSGHAMTGLNGIAAVDGGDYAGAMFSNPALPTTGLTGPYGGVEGADPPGSFEIFVVPAGNSNQRPSTGISCLNGFCNRWDDGGTVNVQVSSGGRLSDSEMTKVLNGITLADVKNETTWSPVNF